MTRADSTRRQTPTFQRPLSKPMSSRPFSAPASRAPAASAKHRPINYDYVTGSTFAVKVNGKPVFMLNDFRKKVEGNVKQSRYVSAFKAALQQQVQEKKKQDAIRDQYERTIVPRFRPVEHTETGLTKTMLGLGDQDSANEPFPVQGSIGYSRIDQIDPWENASQGGLEKYNPCVTSVMAPVQFQGLDDTHKQWQREPSSHLSLDFVYGYQGASCWDQELFGEGPGLENLHFLQAYDSDRGCMVHTGEIVYFAAATVIVFDVKNNVQRFLHHTNSVSSIAVLKRVYQKPDASWAEMEKPTNPLTAEQWEMFFAYTKGVYTPGPKKWKPTDRTLPVSTEEFPQMFEGGVIDWRDWDLPNRCIVASGQKGRNPRIIVWRVTPYDGRHEFKDQILATMSLGPKRIEVVSLSFNSKGNYLVAMANDFEHHITVFDWKNKNGPMKIREGQAHGGKVDICKFNEYSMAAFASCGEKHMKMWELGDVELEMATGLFGDIADPLNQRCICFTPKGNVVTGVENGDVYIWSVGKVQAKIERAHKEQVLGILYVDKVGLFTAGKGGYLKMWDPELRDLKKPKCVIDLRSFTRKCDPSLIAKISVRSMDWSSSKTLFSYMTDESYVREEPAKGIRGAPATHLSFADLGVEGCLLVGMTDNTILMLGLRRCGQKDRDSWIFGLSENHRIRGDSANSIEGRLGDQEWWGHDKVREWKGSNGAVANRIPVCTFWYQRFDESKPGYMPNDSQGCPWEWAVCGKRVVMRGHMQPVYGIAPIPDERIFMSVSKDCSARFFDINDQIMISSVYTYKQNRSATFWYEESGEGVHGAAMINNKPCSLFAIGHEDGSFSVWNTEKSSFDAANQDDENVAGDTFSDPFFDPEEAFGNINLCCFNPLPRQAYSMDSSLSSSQVMSLKYSPDGKYLAVALGDNCIDIYRHRIERLEETSSRDREREYAKQKSLGMSEEEILLQSTMPYKRVGCCNDHSGAVTHVDFDAESGYLRSTSMSNELLYCVIPSGKQSVKTEELSKKKWATHNCVLGWTVKSIWRRGSTGSDINSIDRSHSKVPPWAPCHGGNDPSPYPYVSGEIPNDSAEPEDVFKTHNFPGEGQSSSWGHNVCATGDDDGKVKLFRWPAFGFKQAFRSYYGHGSFVSQVRFSYDDDYLISAGGTDMSIFQWRHVIPNKVYVQNLPDKKVGGEYVLSNWELKEILTAFFTAFLKVDRDITAAEREKDEEFRAFREEVQSILPNHLTERQRRRILHIANLHREAWKKTHAQSALPNREIVAVEVFDTGAAHEGRMFPSADLGSKISSRWATIVFRSKEEVDDVIDVYGSDNVLNNLELLKENKLMLLPLHRPTGDYTSNVMLNQYHNSEFQEISRIPLVHSSKSRDKQEIWKPLTDEDYSEETCGGRRPHFLLVTAYDPNESMLPAVTHDAMQAVSDRNSNKLEFGAQAEDEWDYVKHLAKEQEKEWKKIQDWLMSDDDYGCGDSSHFNNYMMWSELQERKRKVKEMTSSKK